MRIYINESFSTANCFSALSDDDEPGNEQTTSLRDLSGTPAPDNSNAWGNFLAGARRIIDTIIDLGEDEDEQGDVKNEDAKGQTRSYNQSGSEDESLGTEDLVEAKTTAPRQLVVLSSADQSVSTTRHSMKDVSNLMEEGQIAALLQHIPLRHRQSTWNLVYSTQRDGISMQTLLRKAKGKSPTVLVVRDMGRAVFGAYCSEPWHLASRYYGTGETFVFQLVPRQVVWHWWSRKMDVQQNDFFMWGSSEALAVGGAGGYALWLDAELSHGISRSSLTFGNDSLSSTEEFKIGAVELWWLN